jgi:hypothetical protein
VVLVATWTSFVVVTPEEAHSGHVRQPFDIHLADFATTGEHAVQAGELSASQGGQDVGQAVVETGLGVLIVLTFRTSRAGYLGNCRCCV